MRKKRRESDTLKKLEQLLIEDVRRNRSQKEQFRDEWRRIAVRMSAYMVMIILFRIIGVLPSIRMALAILTFFIMVEFLRYFRIDLQIKRFLKGK